MSIITTPEKATPIMKVLLCYHCGNKTLMERVNQHKYTWSDDNDHIFEVLIWDMYFCSVCENVTLELSSHFSEAIDYDGSPIWEHRIIYPSISQGDRNMPSEVKNAYEAALKVRNIDDAICALALRRTLEMMCKDKGETGGNLATKLKKLATKGTIPPLLGGMASILKNLGNAAAHADRWEHSPELISTMFDFTQVILDYVYVLPERLATIQNKLAGESKPNT